MKITRREEDGDNFASSSVTFRILVLLVGVFFGFVLSSHASSTGVQKLHSNVKKAYRAQNEAKKEYLKRYRESYLEAVLDRGAQKQEEERGEKGGDEAVAEVQATMSGLAEERVQEQIENISSGKSDGDGSTAVKELPERVGQKGNQHSQHLQRGNVHLYVLQHLSDCGLGHLMEQFGNIYEICDELGLSLIHI